MESSNNNSSSFNSHKYNTRSKNSTIRKCYKEYNTDFSDSNFSDSDISDSYISNITSKESIINDNDKDNHNENFDLYKYRKLLSEIFPSKYMKDKVKNMKKSKKQKSNSNVSDFSRGNIIIYKCNNKNNNYPKINNKKIKDIIDLYNDNNEDSEDLEEDEDYDELDGDDEEDSDEDDDEDEDDDDEDEEEEEDEDDDENGEDEDDDEDDDDDDDEESEEEKEEDEEDEEVYEQLLNDNHSELARHNKKLKINDSKSLDILAKKLNDKYKANTIINELVRIANNRKEKGKGIIKKKEREEVRKMKLEKNKELKRKRQITNNVNEFRKLLSEKDNMNDVKYFKTEIELENQQEIIDKLKIINQLFTVDKPYRIILLELQIPQHFKVVALKKITMLENMDPSVSEYFKLKNWIDTFMRIPFNKFSELPFNYNDGIDKCSDYMDKSIKTLNDSVFGLQDAKMQIMQLIGQWIVNPNAMGTAIAIKGPMGTGKTTLVKNGISKILNRPFALIALGGATDASTLEGHGYTYEGSTYGKIIDILINTKCSNPIIYFDELDKVSDSPKGEEIIGILTHLIDTTQNGCFHDKYFSEIDFDLSKALFIFSYNDESKINPILLDRMYKIGTKGYNLKEKNTISKDYLLPNISKQVNFEDGNIVFPEETVNYIIENYTDKEQGVRNLKRCLETIYTKLNLYRLVKPDSLLFGNDKSIKLEFPFTVTKKNVEELLKKENQENDNWKRMYM
tara:strand:+ start:386 stop:2596 length:2211 start_codon:yes stop_codon:yes gene_type:complete